MRSNWRNWGCLIWRKGVWGETSSCSESTRKEAAVRRASSVTSDRIWGNGLNLLRGGLDQIAGRISSQKGWLAFGTGCPGRWQSCYPWRNLRNVGMWSLGKWFSGGLKLHLKMAKQHPCELLNLLPCIFSSTISLHNLCNLTKNNLRNWTSLLKCKFLHNCTAILHEILLFTL